MNVDN